jgi:hypothetical protein
VSFVLSLLLAGLGGLVIVGGGAALYGPSRWSAARLLRAGRRVTATVVRGAPGGATTGNHGVYSVGRTYPATVRLAFTLDERQREKTLRLAEFGAKVGYEVGQPVDLYVAGRLRTRIRSAGEVNAHGEFERALGACFALAGIAVIIAVVVSSL